MQDDEDEANQSNKRVNENTPMADREVESTTTGSKSRSSKNKEFSLRQIVDAWAENEEAQEIIGETKGNLSVKKLYN